MVLYPPLFKRKTAQPGMAVPPTPQMPTQKILPERNSSGSMLWTTLEGLEYEHSKPTPKGAPFILRCYLTLAPFSLAFAGCKP
jgi:hypothetical protein